MIQCTSVIHAQEDTRKPSRQSSLEAFSKGDYETAYKEFSELLKIFTKDPLYKYYSGVCLVKLNRDPLKAAGLIEESLQGASAVKTISSDAWFYLGRARQMSGNYLSAIEAYNLYTDQAGKKSAREMGVPQFVQQCMDNKGAIPVQPAEAAEPKTEIRNEAPAPETGKDPPVAAPVAVVPAAVASTEKKTTPRQAVTSEYELILSQALEYQIRADSLNALAASGKANLNSISAEEKQRVVASISAYEAQAASFQKKADEKYNEARAAMNPKPAATVENSTGQAPATDAGGKGKVQSVPAAGVPASVAGSTVLFSSIPGNAGKVEIDPQIPSGLVYRIQMGVFRNPLTASYFKGLAPAQGFRVQGTDKTAYYVGIFRKIADARQALNTVKAKGFKDSFIVSLLDGKSVSSDRATVLEKEWGDKPLYGTAGSKSVAASDTIPPELTFRVEAMRPAKPVKDDAAETLKKIAGSRGLEVRTLEDGKTSYMIGRFITPESAAEYADLLMRNGYPEAKVVAWLGDKEIPLERAKKLFEN